MKRKTFNLYTIGDGGKLTEIQSYDYDEDLCLVRYKDAVYDMSTGRWIVTLSRMQKGFDTWKGCGKFPETTITTMIPTIKKNRIFMHRLEKQREKVREAGLDEHLNQDQLTLFSI